MIYALEMRRDIRDFHRSNSTLGNLLQKTRGHKILNLHTIIFIKAYAYRGNKLLVRRVKAMTLNNPLQTVSWFVLKPNKQKLLD